MINQIAIYDKPNSNLFMINQIAIYDKPNTNLW